MYAFMLNQALGQVYLLPQIIKHEAILCEILTPPKININKNKIKQPGKVIGGKCFSLFPRNILELAW
jgi:hypothetical protein